MIVNRIYSNDIDDERLFSVLLTEEECRLFAELAGENYSGVNTDDIRKLFEVISEKIKKNISNAGRKISVIYNRPGTAVRNSIITTAEHPLVLGGVATVVARPEVPGISTSIAASTSLKKLSPEYKKVTDYCGSKAKNWKFLKRLSKVLNQASLRKILKK